MRNAPPLLQEHFIERFDKLQDWEKMQLLSSLQRIASLMDAENIDASPILSSGVATAAIEDIGPAIGLAGDAAK